MWNDSNLEVDDECSTCDAPSLPKFDHNATQCHHSTVLSQWLIGFLINLQMKFYLPDRALTLLLKFLSAFFTVLGKFCPLVELLARAFPSSLHSLRKNIGIDNSYTNYVVCPKCELIYQHADCVDVVGSLRHSKRCSHVKFPDHPHLQRRKSCGTLLLKTVELKSGKNFCIHSSCIVTSQCRIVFKVYCFVLGSMKTVNYGEIQCIIVISKIYMMQVSGEIFKTIWDHHFLVHAILLHLY